LYDFIPIELRTLGTLSEDDERLKTYQFFADAHEQSVTAAIVKKYVNAIKDNGYVINASVLEVLDRFNDEIELYFTHVNT
jgi:membrane-bound lytic murein transglycosylase MltF